MLLFCVLFTVLAADDFEIVLQELDHVTLTEDAESTPLNEFTDSNFLDQPTRIFNNINEITYVTMTLDNKSYLYKKVEMEDILELD